MAATHTPNLNLNKPDRQDFVSVVHDINDNMDKIDEEAGMVDDGIAIVIDGNTAPRAISSGQYLLIKNHSTLATGGYHATANIANGASVTSSNVAADSDGIANALNSKIEPIVVNSSETVASKCTRNAPIEIKPGATGAPRSGYGYIGYCSYGGTSFRHVIVSEYSTGNLFFSFGSSIGTTWYQISYSPYNT